MNAIESEIARHERDEENHRKAVAMVSRFINVPHVDYLYAYEGGILSIDARTAPENAISCVAGFLRAVGEKEAKKEFDENSGVVKYVIKSDTLKPWDSIVISAGKPKYCEMESYEVEEEIPAHTSKRTKYRLVDPNCVGAMK